MIQPGFLSPLIPGNVALRLGLLEGFALGVGPFLGVMPVENGPAFLLDALLLGF